jgi:hypothetical protein
MLVARQILRTALTSLFQELHYNRVDLLLRRRMIAILTDLLGLCT